MSNYEVGQPVIVIVGFEKRYEYDGVVTKVGRALVTIDYNCWNGVYRDTRQFRIDDQRENLPSSRQYAQTPRFRTLEQHAETEEREDIAKRLKAVGVNLSALPQLSNEAFTQIIEIIERDKAR